MILWLKAVLLRNRFPPHPGRLLWSHCPAIRLGVFCPGCNGGSVVLLSVHMCRLGCHVGCSAVRRNPGLSEQSSVFVELARRLQLLVVQCRVCSACTQRCAVSVTLSNSANPSVMRCARLSGGISFESGVPKVPLHLNPLAMFTAPPERKDNF